MTDINRKNDWTLVTIADPNHLSGKSLESVFKILISVIEFKFVIVDDISGAKVSTLIEKQNTILEIDKLLKQVLEVVQFDWGDFFLFKDYPQNWVNFKNSTYPDIIFQTNTTVRAVDDGFIYIYTPYHEVVNIMEKNYQIESLTTDCLDNLSFPF